MSCMTILFLNLLIARSDIRPHTKWAVRLVIAYGHFNLPQGFVWVCMGQHTHFITPKGIRQDSFVELNCNLLSHMIYQYLSIAIFCYITFQFKYIFVAQFDNRFEAKNLSNMYIIYYIVSKLSDIGNCLGYYIGICVITFQFM